jgi:NADPH:quinone reductase-like Zn-dependent oxidoreductase
MSDYTHLSGLQLRSLIKSNGELELSLARLVIPEPAADEIVVRVDATPINPSDIGLMFGPADMSTAVSKGVGDDVVVTAKVPEERLRTVAGRVGLSMSVGNEGAGTVVKAGATASALVGKNVSMIGGSMYAQYRVLKIADCEILPDGVSAADGASWFVNPLTALGMTEAMKREGHTALVHTAAASNLGQMLNKICQKDGIGLINIVRNIEQEKILRRAGAKHVLNSSSVTFAEELVNALLETGATIAFDAIGGGKLAGQILSCMEMALNREAKVYSRYGSSVHKQVYVYGNLDGQPIELARNFGLNWGLCGWLLFPFLQKIGEDAVKRLRKRSISELKSTFSSHYSDVVSLQEMLDLRNVAAFYRRATSTKFLINPGKHG